MKVLFISTVTTEANGITNLILSLLQSFNSSEFEFGYVSINVPNSYIVSKLKKLDVKLYIIPRKISNPIPYVTSLTKICKKYDVVHAHGNSATMTLEMMAAWMAGVKLRIAHCHNTTCNYKTIDKILRPLFYKICNARMACGKEAGAWLFNERPFKVLNNGINTKRFAFNPSIRSTIRQNLGLSEKTILLGSIGSFVTQKNHMFLLDILYSISIIRTDVKLLLLGDGPLKANIEGKLKELKLDELVIMPGSVTNTHEYMNALDLIVMPSLHEGLPLVLLESQANGLSAVVSDTVTPDVNITGNIFFFPLTSSPQSWAHHILSLLSNIPPHNNLASEKAIHELKLSGYDTEDSAESLKKFYLNLL